jgi:hypothetical protein
MHTYENQFSHTKTFLTTHYNTATYSKLIIAVAASAINFLRRVQLFSISSNIVSVGRNFRAQLIITKIITRLSTAWWMTRRRGDLNYLLCYLPAHKELESFNCAVYVCERASERERLCERAESGRECVCVIYKVHILLPRAAPLFRCGQNQSRRMWPQAALKATHTHRHTQWQKSSIIFSFLRSNAHYTFLINICDALSCYLE